MNASQCIAAAAFCVASPNVTSGQIRQDAKHYAFLMLQKPQNVAERYATGLTFGRAEQAFTLHGVTMRSHTQLLEVFRRSTTSVSLSKPWECLTTSYPITHSPQHLGHETSSSFNRAGKQHV